MKTSLTRLFALLGWATSRKTQFFSLTRTSFTEYLWADANRALRHPKGQCAMMQGAYKDMVRAKPSCNM